MGTSRSSHRPEALPAAPSSKRGEGWLQAGFAFFWLLKSEVSPAQCGTQQCSLHTQHRGAVLSRIQEEEAQLGPQHCAVMATAESSSRCFPQEIFE